MSRPASPLLWLTLLGAAGLWLYSRTEGGSSMITRAAEAVGGALGPRGIRNNNPGNIRRTSDRWMGMSADQSSDADFVVFDSPLYGLRALARVLMNYARQGADTVTEIITRWAPPSENQTGAYIASVAAATGLDPHEQLTDADLPSLIAAIVKHENGSQPYSPTIIEQAVQLARSA